MQPVVVQIAAEHPAFPGHFPGSPLLPGVCLLAEIIEIALGDPAHTQALGCAPRIAVAKFLAPVRPGAELAIQLRSVEGKIRFEAWQGPELAASGHFEAVTGPARP